MAIRTLTARLLEEAKEAYSQAREWGELGPVTMRAFQGAFRAGKRVRSKTQIGRGAETFRRIESPSEVVS